MQKNNMLIWGKPGVLFDLYHHDCLQYYAVFIASAMIIYFTHMTGKKKKTTKIKNVFMHI